MPKLNVGDPAPEFSLQDCYGNNVSLEDQRGKKFVLYFFTSSGGGN